MPRPGSPRRGKAHARRATLRYARSRRPAGGTGRYKFRVLFIEDPAGWSAQVLEHDIATQADSLEALFHEVERILRSHLALARAKGRAPFADLPPAPEKYWDVFHKSQLAVRGAETRPINRPPSDITQDIRIAVQIAA